MTIIDDNWIYKQSTTGANRDVETIITGDTDGDYVRVVRCKDCTHFIELPEGSAYPSFCSKLTHLPNIFRRDKNWFCGDGERRETE